MTVYKSLYSQFLAARPSELHFAAHSHHFWPDVTRQAQLQAWDDAARLNDRKWEYIFQHIVPKIQNHIARLLRLKNPAMIALAPNTHDLLVRVLGEVIQRPHLKLLTTDSEFHSFARQLRRWEEVYPQLQVTRHPTSDLLTAREQFLEHFARQIPTHDVVFLSQVFFNSGLTLTVAELSRLVALASPSTIFIIDGYHGFAALPTDLSGLEGRIFYLGGGYKYAQGGEGVGFMVAPSGPWRPLNTGWFAEYGQLSAPVTDKVSFSDDGMAFWGATLEPTGWYRFLAVWDQFQELGIGVDQIHQHVRQLQTSFLAQLPDILKQLTPLFRAPLTEHGHFLTFEAKEGIEEATRLRQQLLQKQIYVDQRGARLRFGFGLYQDLQDIAELLKRLS